MFLADRFDNLVSNFQRHRRSYNIDVEVPLQIIVESNTSHMVYYMIAGDKTHYSSGRAHAVVK